MRALAVGSILFLGLAAVLLSWDDAPLRAQVRSSSGPSGPDSGIASPSIAGPGADPSASQPQGVVAAGLEGARSGIAAFGRTLADFAQTVSAKPQSAKSVVLSRELVTDYVPDNANTIVVGSSAKVREFTPGSVTHAEAIASAVASQEAEHAVAPVARLYFAYFNRAPDYEGLNYYIDERDGGRPLDAIAQEFAGSLEFERRYGTLDNETFVDRIYENVYGVAVDPEQRAFWIAQLESGGMTRGQVMLAFSEGAGFRALIGNEVFVAMAYAETLQRAPDPTELAHWVGFLDAGHPRRGVIDGLLALRPKP